MGCLLSKFHLNARCLQNKNLLCRKCSMTLIIFRSCFFERVSVKIHKLEKKLFIYMLGFSKETLRNHNSTKLC